MYKFFCGIVLSAWGIWCLIAAIRKEKAKVLIFYNDEFLPKKILGRFYDPFMNLLYGTIALAAGIFLILNYFK